MNANPDAQLTTEGKLICGAIILADMFENGRLRATDPADEEVNKALRHAVAAMVEFRAEIQSWPDGTH